MTTIARAFSAMAPARPSLRALIRLHRSRRALARLDDAALRDIGVTREAARREAARPVWDVPCAWRRRPG